MGLPVGRRLGNPRLSWDLMGAGAQRKGEDGTAHAPRAVRRRRGRPRYRTSPSAKRRLSPFSPSDDGREAAVRAWMFLAWGGPGGSAGTGLEGLERRGLPGGGARTGLKPGVGGLLVGL